MFVSIIFKNVLFATVKVFIKCLSRSNKFVIKKLMNLMAIILNKPQFHVHIQLVNLELNIRGLWKTTNHRIFFSLFFNTIAIQLTII